MAGSRVSQQFLEQVREALSILGISGGGGPDLSVPVAQLQADVAALQASDTQQASDISSLQASDSAQQSALGDLSFKASRAWVRFNSTATSVSGLGVQNVDTNGGPGLFRITFQAALDDQFVAVFGAVGDVVKEVARTESTLDIDAGAATFISVAVFGGTLA